MPKVTKHPRLRTLVRKGARGQRWVYYYFDMRPEGKPDVALGKDYALAVAKWDELYNKRPARVGTIQQAIDLWREQVLDGTKDSPSPYTNAETRRDYTRHLKRVEAWCGAAAWHDITVPAMRKYLRDRTGKVQANRELAVLSIVWNYARKEGLTDLPWPAAGLEKSGWKNVERAREVEVTDAMFDAVRAQGDQILRDAMDIASATGMRVTDTRTVPLPPGEVLHLRAGKTGKRLDFPIAGSVLADVVRRRRANKRALHLKLLTAPSGREVSYRMLADRFATARKLAAAATQDQELAAAIRGMILRDCRKYAADLAGTADDAQKLLQHGNVATTMRHYRTRADQAKPVR